MIRQFHLDAGCAHTFRCIAHNYGYSAFELSMSSNYLIDAGCAHTVRCIAHDYGYSVSEPARARARAAACGADSRICVSNARSALRAAVRALALALAGSFKKIMGVCQGGNSLVFICPLDTENNQTI